MSSEKRILVGVPIPHSYMCNAKLVAQIESWHAALGVETYYPATNSAEDGQHKIVDFAMYGKPRATHILFIDYDVIPKTNTLKRLLSHDKDIISGAYPLYQKKRIDWCLSLDDPFKAIPYNDEIMWQPNPFKAKVLSNGLMLVKTEVFENLGKPYWRTLFDDDITSRTLGADLYFFKKAREAGYDLWVDPKVKCEHVRSVGLLELANTYRKQQLIKE